MPKGMAILAEIDGIVEIDLTGDGRRVKVVDQEEYQEEYLLPDGYQWIVKKDDWVDIGTPLAHRSPTDGKSKKKRSKADKIVAEDEENEAIASEDLVARVSGKAQISAERVILSWVEQDQREYPVPAAAHLVVENGQEVRAGNALTSGPMSPQDILRILGPESVHRYLVSEVQAVYRSQGITINDKHIEVIVRQMLRKVRVEAPGDSELLPGEMVDRFAFQDTNAKVLAEGGEPATASPLLLGVTRASLNTESFLAAASFQETTRVLTEAAVNGATDGLLGLKENVIIGRLIPARLDVSQRGRDRLGISSQGELSEALSFLDTTGSSRIRDEIDELDARSFFGDDIGSTENFADSGFSLVTEEETESSVDSFEANDQQ